jgi:hypothetical protein
MVLFIHALSLAGHWISVRRGDMRWYEKVQALGLQRYSFSPIKVVLLSVASERNQRPIRLARSSDTCQF